MTNLFALVLLGSCVIGMALGQSPSPYDLNRVKADEQPPDFTLPTHDGRKVSLSALRGKNVVLVFYRGYW